MLTDPSVFSLCEHIHILSTEAPFVHYFLENDEGSKFKKWDFYEEWKVVIACITKKKKTPHEARHTFETFLDNAGGNRKCIDMLMGHKSKDVGNRVYNHKTLEQLRETVNLLN